MNKKNDSLLKPAGWLISVIACLTVAVVSLTAETAHADQPYYLFESGQVRPMAMSPNGQRLFVANTPDNRVEVFRITPEGLRHQASVPVGMEPVALAARGNSEVWVVNHLSDTVSVMSQASGTWRVTNTLAVSDAPRDIVFAGTPLRAFVTAVNRADLPRETGSDKRHADVWVFDAATRQNISVINLFADVPRPLAVSPDGNTVYVGIFNSGNQTTVVSEDKVKLGLGMPAPLTNIDGVEAPITSLIVRNVNGDWIDAAGRNWNDDVTLELPDYDIFTIDASAPTPVETGRISTVSTTLFNMATHPLNGDLYVSNLESRNYVRFGGPGIFGGSTVNGYLTESRITIVDPVTASVTPRDLNKHLDRSKATPGTPSDAARSLAFPQDLTFSSNGSTLYVTAFGSSKIGVFSTVELEDDSFVPDESSHIEVGGGGPTGVILNEAQNRLYVLKRFSNSVGVIDLSTNSEIGDVSLHNPEPAEIVAGRPFLYDARISSSRGSEACHSCHFFGDTDNLSWDVGNPDGSVLTNPNPFKIQQAGNDIDFHPMKGPMFTQTMRGIANHGPMHWRGDQTGGNDPGGDSLDEAAALSKFNGAFTDLQLGYQLVEDDINALVDFGLQIFYPPNPIRSIDNTLTATQQAGRDFYLTYPVVLNTFPCTHCHVLEPENGFYGSDGLSIRIGGPNSSTQNQPMKAPQLRDIYFKVIGAPEDGERTTGPQIRGFNTGHDGANEGKLLNFFDNPAFDFPNGDAQRLEIINFLMAYDNNLAPVVAQQVTMRPGNRPVARQRLDIFIDRCLVGECDLVVKGNVGSEMRGFLMLPDGLFQSDRASEPTLARTGIETISQMTGQEMTFTAAPPGSGLRMAIDRDEDGVFDRDEIDAGSNPSDSSSIPAAN